MIRFALPAALLFALAACGQGRYVEQDEYNDPRNQGGERGSILGEGGLVLFGTSTNRNGADGAGALGVNAFLWRGTLDTLSFMPLASADPFGGVIITDWYSDPTTPNERFKATVYILDTRLRADALNVSIFKQTQQNGQWVDATVDPDTEIQIENAILTRARQLRLSNVR